MGSFDQEMTERKRCVALLSGGLDSAVAAAIAKKQGLELYALTVDYGQKNRFELEAAKKMAEFLGAREHVVLKVPFGAIASSALTREDIDVPKDRSERDRSRGIPQTYVPARNIILLALACSWAESIGAEYVFVGFNILDYSGYPDCRPEFIKAFEHMLEVGTKAGVDGKPVRIKAPLLMSKKSEIVRLGHRLGVDFALTMSCYEPTPDGKPCGRCDSCLIRRRAFEEAGIKDPLLEG